MKKIESSKAKIMSTKAVDDLRKQHLLNVSQAKLFTIEEARMYSKNKIAEFSKI
jgi:hypothetical protein